MQLQIPEGKTDNTAKTKAAIRSASGIFYKNEQTFQII